MGKKKAQQHLQQSMGNMVSKAALAQLWPHIAQMIKTLGDRLTAQQAQTLENLYARTVVLEKIVMEKLGYTSDDLAEKIALLEDEAEKLALATDEVKVGDVVRLVVATKTKDDKDWQGESRIKMYGTGTGNTLGNQLETGIIGMKPGEVKEIQFDEATAKVTISRISRPIPKPEVKKEETPNETENAGK